MEGYVLHYRQQCWEEGGWMFIRTWYFNPKTGDSKYIDEY